MNKQISLIAFSIFFLLAIDARSQWNTITGGIYYSSGNVGIGTSTPKAYLDVGAAVVNKLNTVFARLPEGNTTGDGTYLGVRSLNTTTINAISFSLEHKFYDNLNSAINFYRGGSMTGGFITFATNDGTEKMRIDQNGNVGIGTVDPQGYKLAVNGSAIFTKAVVKAYGNWPDYVFDEKYSLPSLDSVEKFISIYKHLPKMPSAQEINQTGIDLAENQKALLEKTEELTLYILQEKQMIESLKNVIGSLEKRIDEIQKKKQE